MTTTAPAGGPDSGPAGSTAATRGTSAPGTKEQRRMADSAQDGRRAERLELRVPTTATQLPAVRAMAGDLALRMDYDLDSVEDLRLAVDEACAILALVADGDARLTVVFETTRTGLHIDAWVPTAEGTDVPRDGFGWAVLQ